LTFTMSDEWRRLRADTPGAAHVVHFNNAGAALMPGPVVDAIQKHLQLEAEIGGYEAARERSDEIAEIYANVAAVIGARADNIALTANATDAYARALSSIAFKRGDVIVAAWSEYASNQIQLLSLEKRIGIRIVRAPALASGQTDLDALDAILKREQPRLVVTVHVNTSAGIVDDVAGIGGVCRRHDVLYMIDGCQSFGQMPIDVEHIACDFFSATSRKFLRGPRGAGLLYVSDRVLSDGLEPMFLDLRGAELEDEQRYHPVHGAKRFEDWEFSYATLFGFGAAAAYANEIGLSRIEARLAEVNDYLRARLQRLPGWRVLDEGVGACPIIPIHAAAGDGAAIHRRLCQLRINTTYIPKIWAPMDPRLADAGWAIRISPHYYNSPADMDALLGALGEAVS
jgi:selenocysteine lyase/cysteine desulfurase